jgi:hypothetical protein
VKISLGIGRSLIPIIEADGEAEAGSAGEQPAEEYPFETYPTEAWGEEPPQGFLSRESKDASGG